MINACEVEEPVGSIYRICSQGTHGCNIYHYDPDHIKADDIAHALILINGTLSMLSYLPSTPFYSNVVEAIDAYNQPGIRAELVNRIYFRYSSFDYHTLQTRLGSQIRKTIADIEHPKAMEDMDQLNYNNGRLEALKDVLDFVNKKADEVKPLESKQKIDEVSVNE
jgi:hypothetical protein